MRRVTSVPAFATARENINISSAYSRFGVTKKKVDFLFAHYPPQCDSTNVLSLQGVISKKRVKLSFYSFPTAVQALSMHFLHIFRKFLWKSSDFLTFLIEYMVNA